MSLHSSDKIMCVNGWRCVRGSAFLAALCVASLSLYPHASSSSLVVGVPSLRGARYCVPTAPPLVRPPTPWLLIFLSWWCSDVDLGQSHHLTNREIISLKQIFTWLALRSCLNHSSWIHCQTCTLGVVGCVLIFFFIWNNFFLLSQCNHPQWWSRKDLTLILPLVLDSHIDVSKIVQKIRPSHGWLSADHDVRIPDVSHLNARHITDSHWYLSPTPPTLEDFTFLKLYFLSLRPVRPTFFRHGGGLGLPRIGLWCLSHHQVERDWFEASTPKGVPAACAHSDTCGCVHGRPPYTERCQWSSHRKGIRYHPQTTDAFWFPSTKLWAKEFSSGVGGGTIYKYGVSVATNWTGWGVHSSWYRGGSLS